MNRVSNPSKQYDVSEQIAFRVSSCRGQPGLRRCCLILLQPLRGSTWSTCPSESWPWQFDPLGQSSLPTIRLWPLVNLVMLCPLNLWDVLQFRVDSVFMCHWSLEVATQAWTWRTNINIPWPSLSMCFWWILSVMRCVFIWWSLARAVEVRRAVAAAATAKLPTTNFQLGSKEATCQTKKMTKSWQKTTHSLEKNTTSDSDVLRDLKMREIDLIWFNDLQ